MEFVILIFVIIFLIAVFSPKKTNQKTIELDVPNPDKCQDQTMIDFIKNTPDYKLELVFKEYIKKGFVLKPIFLDAYNKKVNSQLHALQVIQADIEAKKATFKNEDTFEITGVHIADRKRRIRNTCDINDRVFLQAEPSNKFDKNAIKVKNYDGKIGYIKSEETDDVHPIIKGEYYAYIAIIDDYDNYLSLEIKILS